MGLFSIFKPRTPVFKFNPKDLQKKLKLIGYYNGEIDGDIGSKSKSAIISFKKSAGLKATSYVGPITWDLLKKSNALPWMTEISKVFGLHEKRDKGALSKWLRSDGKTLGDPTKLPWCGDAVETAMRLGMPAEPFPSVLSGNPYWARNWAQFGAPCGEIYGAVASFVRGKGGHVAFLVGVSADGKLYRIRGGNQSDTVSDTWISKSRLLALRFPITASANQRRAAPIMNSNGAVISTNEA